VCRKDVHLKGKKTSINGKKHQKKQTLEASSERRQKKPSAEIFKEATLLIENSKNMESQRK